MMITILSRSQSSVVSPAHPLSAHDNLGILMGEKYHCVSIEYKGKACELVTGLGGKRFLSADAPLLPLCASSSCQCFYRHYDDRRLEERREPSLLSKNWAYPERRKNTGGRRTEDALF